MKQEESRRFNEREAEWRHRVGTDEVVGPHPAAVMAPLADRVEFTAAGAEIAPGVRVLATPGHTPGHQSLVVTDPSGADSRGLVILGDVMHCQVQVTESRLAFVFDVDPEQGVRTRQGLLADFGDDNTIVAGGHFAGHVFGRVLPAASVRAWASAERIGETRAQALVGVKEAVRR